MPGEDLLYVGPGTSRKLLAGGSSTIGRLAEWPAEFLERWLGKMGVILHTVSYTHLDVYKRQQISRIYLTRNC